MKLKFKGDLEFFNKFQNNELIAKDNINLIGKRANFKDNLKGYISAVWNKKGVIVDSERTPYLYLKFDKPYKTGLGGSMITKSLVIEKGSIEVLQND